MPVFDHPHCTSFFLCLEWNFSLCLLSCDWPPERRICTCFLLQGFLQVAKTLLRHLFSSSLSLSLYEICSHSLVIFVAFCWRAFSSSLSLLVVGSRELDPTFQVCLSHAEQRARILSLDLLVTLGLMQLMQHRKLTAFFAVRAHFWLKFRTRASSIKLFFQLYLALILSSSCFALISLEVRQVRCDVGLRGDLVIRSVYLCAACLPSPAGSRGNLHSHQLGQHLSSAAGLGAL